MIDQVFHISWAELPFQGVNTQQASMVKPIKIILLKHTGWYESAVAYLEQGCYLWPFQAMCKAQIILVPQNH